ncbi:helix-turn-helix transcriptional regulator [Alkaliphilus pronyensis]|uniref:Helix-turn-helix transcriptional regulator n=1 Tax=Alkaliphilus pronyensis TaxID=1482732 RepID=A0A6I0FLK5_9FIRM|nr:helix-turn-helix transcriptional regulator [Alkaliphilus pronyensis]KAB3537354.1 helix-turn-helix transcriptional regulator [Alkaliphilus pronyensis]
MEIISSGKKIRMLRQKIGLRQDQLTDDKITRSLISMIENGKRSLNHKTASIICDKLNLYYRNLGEKVTVECLLETEEKQAEKIIDKQMKILLALINDGERVDHNHILEAFNRIISIAEEWSLNHKIAEIHKIKGEYNLKYCKYSEALRDLFRSVEFYLNDIKSPKVVDVYFSIVKAYGSIGMIDEAIYFCDRIYAIADTYKVSNYQHVKILSLLNKSKLFLKVEKFDLALNTIYQLKEIGRIKDSIQDWIIYIEATALLSLKNYDKAIKLFEKLINRENKKTKAIVEALTYISLAKYNIEIGCKDNGHSYIKMTNDLYNVLNPVEAVEIGLEIAKTYIILENYEAAQKTLEKTSSLLSINNDYRVKIKIIYAVIFMKLRDWGMSLNYLKEAEQIAKEINSKILLKETYCLMGEIHSKRQNYEECEGLFASIRNI